MKITIDIPNFVLENIKSDFEFYKECLTDTHSDIDMEKYIETIIQLGLGRHIEGNARLCTESLKRKREM